MNDNTNKISNILQQIQLLKDKYDELAAVTGEHFNVFSILGVEADEVRTHSAFLADLLNPQGSHRQGTAFLKLFLEKALEYSGPDEYKNFQVTKEASIEQGRIDILLEKNDACIVIENKIYAGDQDDQMEKYDQYAKDKGISEEQIKLVYLTLDGSPPSKGSLGKLPEKCVKCLSYSKDIINWLEECMKLQEVQRISSIREIVFQYRDLLKRLTGQSTNRRYSMELKDILAKDKNRELIPDIENAILEFKVHVQLKFWEELVNIMCNKDYNFEMRDNKEKEALEDRIRNYYTPGKKSLNFGTTFKISTWKQIKIALKVQLISGGYIIYGFILFDKDDNYIDFCRDKNFDTLEEKLPNNGFNRDEWFIGRKYAGRDLVFPRDYSGQNRKYLQYDSNRTESVRELVTEIARAVNQLKENLKTSLRGG